MAGKAIHVGKRGRTVTGNQDIVLVRDEYGGKATAYLHGKDSGFIVYGEDAYKVFGEVTHWCHIPDLEE